MASRSDDPTRPDTPEELLETLLELPARQRASLLARLASEGSEREGTALDVSAPREEGPEEHGEALERIGPYVIKGRLGQGGMGEVFLAEQKEPLRRTVALKVTQSRFLDSHLEQRFRAEQMALARMSHPNIAQVYEAGETPQGHPYLVMEYVPGEPITGFCDRRDLSVEARLELLGAVCRGIHHAHQKGILHRDIKPANVLVTEVHGKPLAKVIDFGIAKPLERSPGETDLTAAGGVVGTPAYLSPESILSSDGSVDTDIRTDVYALGVLLYELLTGFRPFGREGDSFFSILEQITREELIPPSQRFRRLEPADQQQIAARRGTMAAALSRRLRGDLDGIVHQAMARERDHRYGSAAELEADIERHLGHRPVAARRPTHRYHLGKFVRRHRGAVAAGLLLMATLVGGVVARTQEARRANQAAAAALQSEAEAQAVVAFLVDLFEVSDPSEARGNTITARELLDRGARELEERLHDQPLTRARLAETIGTVYRKLGLVAPAQPLLEEALELRLGALGREHPAVASSLHQLGAAQWELGLYLQAETAVRRSLAIRDKAFGPDSLEAAEALDLLGSILVTQGSFPEARELHDRALAIRESVAGPDDLLVAKSLDDMAVWHLDQRLFAQAEPIARRALEIRQRQLGLDHPEVAYSANALAIALSHQGKREEAIELHLRTLETRERILGPRHTDVAQSLTNLAGVYLDARRDDEAEPLLRRAVEIYQGALGPRHRRVGIALFNLADVYEGRGEYQPAEAALRETLSIFEEVHGPDHPTVAFPLTSLGLLLEGRGRLSEAEPLLARALAIRREHLEPGAPALALTAESHQRVVEALGRAGGSP